MEIIPSILTGDLSELKELLSRVDGVTDRVSIDIIDGKFADNKTITPDLLAEIDINLKVDYQLMVIEPVNWIERCVRGQSRLRSGTTSRQARQRLKTKARRADRIIGHVEQMSNQIEFVGKVQEVGIKVGLGLDLVTSVSDLDKATLNNLNTVLVMSVPAGFGGQRFSYQVIEKIKLLRNTRKRDKLNYKIHVDGGVTFDNIKDIADAGADEVSVGRRLFKGDLEKNIEKFVELTK